MKLEREALPFPYEDWKTSYLYYMKLEREALPIPYEDGENVSKNSTHSNNNLHNRESRFGCTPILLGG
jgi:hypothetical protein